MRLVLITGISGSGKSIALNVLEDDGFFCIDNLPVRFLDDVIGALAEAGHERIAVAIDARSGDSVEGLRESMGHLARRCHDIKLLFLNARTEALVQRYSETRRRHPLSLRLSREGEAPTLIEAIALERELMSVIEDLGVSIDTSDLPPNVLRGWVRDVIGAERAPITLLFESFAFKHGVPLDADLVFDARCLPNPYYTPELKPMTGLDPPVAEYLRAIPSVQRLIEHISGFLHAWLPHYLHENRSYLTVAIGCTGGQHRSVYCVEELAREFRRIEHVLVRHRSLASRMAGGS
ncbi:RNase adapter RapZ [Burkholderiaceae bacterium FT117]|uniref:RNase adapter RapZ n=1 Tax=Zeimonas sediminis TaxID=2944268 RepID=UPI002342C671|nr:RNase adapter RapZ [Zeimonas sediminis]MCM5571793.1 RNase adapter RapZ [Zeimonas sediminis]